MLVIDAASKLLRCTFLRHRARRGRQRDETHEKDGA
jgi:hypothetical protein